MRLNCLFKKTTFIDKRKNGKLLLFTEIKIIPTEEMD